MHEIQKQNSVSRLVGTAELLAKIAEYEIYSLIDLGAYRRKSAENLISESSLENPPENFENSDLKRLRFEKLVKNKTWRVEKSQNDKTRRRIQIENQAIYFPDSPQHRQFFRISRIQSGSLCSRLDLPRSKILKADRLFTLFTHIPAGL